MAEGDRIVELKHDKSSARLLHGLRARAEHAQPAMAIVAEMLVTRVDDEWDSAGHGRWKDLAASTKRKRRGNSAQILKDTGRAAASVHGEATSDTAEAYTDVAYMVFHASDAARTVIPYRNPFDLADPEDVAEEAARIILDWISSK